MSLEEPTLAIAGPWQETAWDCAHCRHCNLLGDVCEACGVARRYFEDPPLDLPGQPALHELPSFWIGLVWGAATLSGCIALASPSLRSSLGTTFLLLEVLAAGGACVSSLLTAAWERLFNQVEFEVPAHAPSGSTVTARLQLVPYATMGRVNVRVSLVDRFYRRGRREVELARHALDSQVVLAGGRLPGRRLTELDANFIAPYPITAHTDVQAEITADLIGMAGWAVPALKSVAENYRQHGGYYVEAHVRVGLLSRRFHKRLVTYSLGNDVYVG